MKANDYKILERAIEEGIEWGWTHAHKHLSDPPEEAIKEQIQMDIMTAICEVFNFDDGITEA